MLRIIHAADLHLDSPFASLPPEQAVQRRRQQRQILQEITELCQIADLVLLAGDVFDDRQVCPETVELMKETVTADSPYGLCVERVHTLLENRTVYGHQGMSEDVMCNLYWEPESDFVFAIITNGCVTSQTDHICKLTRRVFEKVWPVYGDGTALVKY